MSLMRCPNCNATTVQVRDSRVVSRTASVRRRRHCTSCRYRWSTWEMNAGQVRALQQQIPSLCREIQVATTALSRAEKLIGALSGLYPDDETESQS